MKLTYFSKPPDDVYVAFSGGVDSVVLLHNLIKRKFKVTLLHVDHNTDWCKEEQEFAKIISKRNNIGLVSYTIPEFDKSTSLESFWSKHRNDIFLSMDKPVLTGHNLDDAIEWYIMSTFTGTPKLLNFQNRNIFRPMLSIRKQTIVDYAKHFNLEHLEDPTNSDCDFNLRNKVRMKFLPITEEIFPGISKTVLRLIREKEKRQFEEIRNNCH
jgi:tRNA(Ile)-lysidine synthase